MKKRSFALATAALASALVLSACSGGSGENPSTDNGGGSEVTQVRWDMQTALPATHWWAGVHQSFADSLAEIGGAAPQITVHPGGSQGIAAADVLSYMGNGRVDIIEVCACYTEGTFPESSLFDQQMLMPTHEAAVEAWQLLKDDLDAVLQERFNAKLLYGGPSDAQLIFSNGPINSLADLQGKVFRTSAQAQTELLNTIPGASGTVMPSADVYSALERGVLDGNVTSTSNTVANSWGEVTKHALVAPLNFSLIYAVVNLDAYNSLSEEAKADLEEAATAAEAEWFATGAQVSDEGRATLEADGIIFQDSSDETTNELRAIAENQWHTWATRVGDTGADWLQKLRDAGFPESYQVR